MPVHAHGMLPPTETSSERHVFRSVTLYVMLAGAYPFEDPDDPRNFRKTIQRIMAVNYQIPSYVHITPECRNMLESIFVADPTKRCGLSPLVILARSDWGLQKTCHVGRYLPSPHRAQSHRAQDYDIWH